MKRRAGKGGSSISTIVIDTTNGDGKLIVEHKSSALDNTLEHVRNDVNGFERALEKAYDRMEKLAGRKADVLFQVVDHITPVIGQVEACLETLANKKIKVFLEAGVSYTNIQRSTGGALYNGSQSVRPVARTAVNTIQQYAPVITDNVNKNTAIEVAGQALEIAIKGKDIVDLGEALVGKLPIAGTIAGGLEKAVTSAPAWAPGLGAAVGVGVAGLGLYNLYKGQTTDDPQESYYYNTQAGLQIGGVAAGALIGSIVPGVGTAIGAGIGGLVGLLGSGVAANNIEKTSESVDGLTIAAKKLMDQGVDRHFQSVSMSVGDIREEAVRLAESKGISLDMNFHNTQAEMEAIKNNMDSRQYSMNHVRWKVETGRGITNQDYTDAVIATGQQITEAYEYINKEEYQISGIISEALKNSSAEEERIKEYSASKRGKIGEQEDSYNKIVESVNKGTEVTEAVNGVLEVLEKVHELAGASTVLESDVKRTRIDKQYGTDYLYSLPEIDRKQAEFAEYADIKTGELAQKWETADKYYSQMLADDNDFGQADYDHIMEQIDAYFMEQISQSQTSKYTATSQDYLNWLKKDTTGMLPEGESITNAIHTNLLEGTEAIRLYGFPDTVWDDNFLTGVFGENELSDTARSNYESLLSSIEENRQELLGRKQLHEDQGWDTKEIEESLGAYDEIIKTVNAALGDSDAQWALIGAKMADSEEYQKSIMYQHLNGMDIPEPVLSSIDPDILKGELLEGASVWTDLADDFYENGIKRQILSGFEGADLDNLSEDIKNLISVDGFKDGINELFEGLYDEDPEAFFSQMKDGGMNEKVREYLDGWFDEIQEAFDSYDGELPDGLPESFQKNFLTDNIEHFLGTGDQLGKRFAEELIPDISEQLDAAPILESAGEFSEVLGTALGEIVEAINNADISEELIPDISEQLDAAPLLESAGMFSEALGIAAEEMAEAMPEIDILDGFWNDVDLSVPPEILDLITVNGNEVVESTGNSLTGNQEALQTGANTLQTNFASAVQSALKKTIQATATVQISTNAVTEFTTGGSKGGGFFSNLFNFRANGGIVGGMELTWVGEEGPEAIIPLVPGRRKRGLELWERAGEMLGVGKNANGGIVGNITSFGTTVKESAAEVLENMSLFPWVMGEMSESLGENSWNYENAGMQSGDSSEDNNSSKVELNVSVNPKFEISGGDSSEEGIVEIIKSHMKDLADDLGGEIALNLEKVFSNMPLKEV